MPYKRRPVDHEENNSAKTGMPRRALIKADRMLYDFSKRLQRLDVMVNQTKKIPRWWPTPLTSW
jgi:hypothetical protein